jgi:hypothetical protein
MVHQYGDGISRREVASRGPTQGRCPESPPQRTQPGRPTREPESPSPGEQRVPDRHDDDDAAWSGAPRKLQIPGRRYCSGFPQQTRCSSAVLAFRFLLGVFRRAIPGHSLTLARLCEIAIFHEQGVSQSCGLSLLTPRDNPHPTPVPIKTIVNKLKCLERSDLRA